MVWLAAHVTPNTESLHEMFQPVVLLGLQIPPEIEDDPNEYEDEGESDAPSEDFDDEEDEEGGVAFPEGRTSCICSEFAYAKIERSSNKHFSYGVRAAIF